MKYLYKLPQKAFPYEEILKENQRRSRKEREYNLIDTDVFKDSRYFDCFIETAKETDKPDELLFRVTCYNRGNEHAKLHILPHVWFRNTWAWGREKPEHKPSAGMRAENLIRTQHPTLGERFVLLSPSPGVGASGDDVMPEVLFTDNDTNYELLYDGENKTKYVKDAFHRYIVDKEKKAVNPAKRGTKTAGWFAFNEDDGVAPGECAGKFGRFASSFLSYLRFYP